MRMSVLLTDDLVVPLMQVSFKNTLLTDALIAPLMKATLTASATVGGRDASEKYTRYTVVSSWSL